MPWPCWTRTLIDGRFDASMVELRDLERASSAIANDCEAELDLDAVVADVRRDLFHEVAADY